MTNFMLKSNRAVVASSFNDRIEEVITDNRFTVFTQRPKSKPEGFIASAADLPDDVNIDELDNANASKQLYRGEVGHVVVLINFVPSDLGVEIAVKVNVPIPARLLLARSRATSDKALRFTTTTRLS